MPRFDPTEFGRLLARLTPQELRQAEGLVPDTRKRAEAVLEIDARAAPTNASIFFITIGHMIRCSRVSGLEVAAFQTPRVFMEICRSGPVRIPALASASPSIVVFPTRSRDRLPLRSSVLLTSSATNRWV